jgi:hypothetical protein
MSRCPRERGPPHLVLEHGQVAQRRHTGRWDSFMQLGPSRQTRLPGHRYARSELDGFMAAGPPFPGGRGCSAAGTRCPYRERPGTG